MKGVVEDHHSIQRRKENVTTIKKAIKSEHFRIIHEKIVDNTGNLW